VRIVEHLLRLLKRESEYTSHWLFTAAARGHMDMCRLLIKLKMIKTFFFLGLCTRLGSSFRVTVFDGLLL
jgi:hypothetical protein